MALFKLGAIRWEKITDWVVAGFRKHVIPTSACGEVGIYAF
jgi:hypothetical protein